MMLLKETFLDPYSTETEPTASEAVLASKCKMQEGPGKLAQTLKNLMKYTNIHEAELSRNTNIHQATLNTLISGYSKNPSISTVLNLLEYFGITLQQLMGRAPIDYAAIKNPIKRASIRVPILEWEGALAWLEGNYFLEPATEWLTVDGLFGRDAFALFTKPFMSTVFEIGSLLIIDPGQTGLCDGAYLMFREDQILNVKQVIQDGTQFYLKAFDNNMPVMPIPKDFIPIGRICENRRVI